MILSLFRRCLARHAMVRRGDGVVLAVSGGADSVCLLHLFLEVREELDLRLVTAHYNHGLRGKASDGDEAFVRRLASSRNLPFVSGKSRTAVRPPGLSRHEALRKERFDFLLSTARRRRCRAVALGHHADDQAETVLMRLLTEGGPAGLGGIPPVSHGGKIIHPLLSVRRRQIEEYLENRRVSWRRDCSNESEVYLRNRLRRHLVPLLADRYNPRIVERLGEVGSLLRSDNELLDGLARRLLTEAPRKRGVMRFPASLLAGTHPSLVSRSLLEGLRSLAPAGTHFSSRHLETLIEESGSARFRLLDLPGGVTASRDGRGLTLYAPGRLPAPPLPFDVPLRVPGSVSLDGGSIRVWASLRRKPSPFDPSAMEGLPWRTALDRERVTGRLRVRCRHPGDRFRPLGMKSDKKLKEMLIDAKVPLPLRDRLPLLCDDGGIVWVPGLRPAHRCRVTAATSKLLILRAEVALPGL